METWISLLNNFAFPVVACIFLAWLYIKQTAVLQEFSLTLKEITLNITQLNVEIKELKDRIN